MNIQEAVSQVARLPEGKVLFAKPPLTWGTEALFVELTHHNRVTKPIKDAGYEYLMGREDIANLIFFLKKKKVSSRTMAEFVIHYAINDSSPAWIDDIRGN
jgi:hypothetical protein